MSPRHYLFLFLAALTVVRLMLTGHFDFHPEGG